MIDLQQTFHDALFRCMGFATMSLEKSETTTKSTVIPPSKYPNLKKQYGELRLMGSIFIVHNVRNPRDRTRVKCSCGKYSTAYVDDLVEGRTVRCMACNNRRASKRWNGATAGGHRSDCNA